MMWLSAITAKRNVFAAGAAKHGNAEPASDIADSGAR